MTNQPNQILYFLLGIEIGRLDPCFSTASCVEAEDGIRLCGLNQNGVESLGQLLLVFNSGEIIFHISLHVTAPVGQHLPVSGGQLSSLLSRDPS
jgi:hypothetical protein